MNIRTLSKRDSLHLINIGSLILAWGATHTYFELIIPNTAIMTIEYFLLAPAVLIEKASMFLFQYSIIGDYSRMLITLWLSYFLAASNLSGLLMIKNYEVAELKSWYLSRK